MAAAAMGFTGSILGQRLLPERALKHPRRDILACKSHQLQAKINNVDYAMHTKKVIVRNPWSLFALLPANSISDMHSHSPAQTIMRFYSAINERNLRPLDELIAEDCLLEDYTFTKPFQGKKEVLHFLGELISSMGQNMQFNVEQICEGSDQTATVNWHIDWNKIQVPFTKGCSFYVFSIDSDELVIKKAQVLVESPIKLGVVALTTFKIVSSVFDTFSMATEWLLKRSHIVFHLLLIGFGMALGMGLGIVIKSIVSPFVAWYVKLLNFTARIIKFAINAFNYIRKIVPL